MTERRALKLPNLKALRDALAPDALAALTPRDRRALIAGAVAAALLLLFGVIVPLDRSVARAEQRLSHKRADLAWMQNAAPELAASPLPRGTGESLLVVVDRSARESGLAGARTEPGAAGSLSVRFEQAPFDALVQWLARLTHQNGVGVESAIIEKTGTPGQVNAAIVLHTG